MSDYVDKLLQDANEIRVIRACHTCQHHEGYGERCLAAGTNLDEARAEGKCSPNLDWWAPLAATHPQAQAPRPPQPQQQKLPLLVRLRKRLLL